MQIGAELLGNSILSIIPSYQHEARWKLIAIARNALETRTLDIAAILRTVATDIGGYLLHQALKQPLADNNDRLHYRYNAIVRVCSNLLQHDITMLKRFV